MLVFDSLFPAAFEWWHLLVLFGAVLLGESFGSLVGGGSIVTIPALLLTGIPLQSAVAVDNAMALGTEAGIISETHQKIRRQWKLVLFMFVPMIFGGIIGTSLLINSSANFIKPIMVVAVAYLLFHSYVLKDRIVANRLEKFKYPLMFAFLFLIGLYNNLVGVGEGTFGRLALMLILGMTFLQSHGIKTIATVPIRLYSLVVTSIAGLIVWPYLVTMWVAAFIAGKFATKFVKHIPEYVLRPALSCISIGFLAYLLFVL